MKKVVPLLMFTACASLPSAEPHPFSLPAKQEQAFVVPSGALR